MSKKQNTDYYENIWEDVTYKPSLAVVDDLTMENLKNGYQFGCIVAEDLAKQKVEKYVLTKKQLNAKSIKTEVSLVAVGAVLTIASGTLTIVEPSFFGLSSTISTLAITSILATDIKSKMDEVEVLMALSNDISENEIHDFKNTKIDFIHYR